MSETQTQTGDSIVDYSAFDNQFNFLNSSLNKNLKVFTTCVESLVSNFISDREMQEMNKGISFLSMKNMLMIEYLTNLLQLVYMKTNGQQISGSPCVVRLAELRCVIEKTKSIEVKLKYQIDKLLKMALNMSNEFDPLSYKPNLNDFSTKTDKKQNGGDKDEDEEEREDEEDGVIRDVSDDDDEEDDDKKADGIYRPPKMAPLYYDLDETPQERMKRKIEKIQRRAINSSMMKDLETEYSGAPEEIRENYANTLAVESNEQRHKREYEEENFLRKPMTKKEIMQTKRLKMGTNLNTLTSFNDARLLLDENLNMEDFLTEKKNRRKEKNNKKGGKKQKAGKKKKKIRYT